jgi:[acyl-carrier-protein] S-malonyltransferase
MIAFTFPGQGSQKPGAGQPWVDHPSWELVAEASDATGLDIAHLLLTADAEELRETHNAQLSTFVASSLVLDAVERLGVEPTACAGHSLGEYTALTAAGVLSFEDGARVVAARGEAMHVAAAERAGTMAAVLGLDDDVVDVACARVDGDVWVANYNAPGQVVVAGCPEAIEQVGIEAKALGAKKVMPVAVSGAFHTPFMAPARERLRKAIADARLRPSETPVVANVDAIAPTDADAWAGLLAAQLCSPVRWRQTLHALAAAGCSVFVELGPGRVLTGMAKRTIDGAHTMGVSTPDDLDRLLELVASPPAPRAVGSHEGEHLFMTERLVVSPVTGVFRPVVGVDAGATLEPGEVVGTVGEHSVRTPFAGTLMGVLALPGERVTASQPVAWLRSGV